MLQKRKPTSEQFLSDNTRKVVVKDYQCQYVKQEEVVKGKGRKQRGIQIMEIESIDTQEDDIQVLSSIQAISEETSWLLIPKFYKFTRIPIYQFSQGNKIKPEILDKLYEQQVTIEEPINPIIEITQIDQYNQQFQSNQDKLIILYFYAKWVVECKDFSQNIEKIVHDNNQFIIMLKIDIDANPYIATQMKIQTVPLIGAVFNNQIIDFYHKKNEEDKFVQQIQRILQIQKTEDVMDVVFESIEELRQNNNHQQVINLIGKLQKEEIEKHKTVLSTYLASSHLALNQNQEAQKSIKLVDESQIDELGFRELYDETIKKLKDIEQNNKEDSQYITYLKEMDKDPKNLELRFKVCEYCIEKQLYEQAIKQLLDLIKLDRSWQEKKAQKTLLSLFTSLGSTNPLVVEGRKALGKILY
ncbi:hypothetical protein pb186bvf_003996 [Paramecium bursaria]